MVGTITGTTRRFCKTRNDFPNSSEKLNSGKALYGEIETHVRWLVDETRRLLLGRWRLKNISAALDAPLWNDEITFIGGHVGYSVCPRHRGNGFSTLGLSYALDECFDMGLEKAFWHIDDSNTKSIRATTGCGGLRIGKLTDSNGETLSRYEIALTGQQGS